MNLPDGYTFTSITNYNLISQLLCDNYVESTNNTFRFNYKPEFIEWYLTINKSISIGIKDNNDIIIGFICGRLINLMLYGKEIQTAEINFLCLDKKIRNKKLCPLLINEITNEFNKIDIYNAIYTSEHLYNASDNMNTQIAKTSYYIRLLNIEKLIEIEYIKTSTSIDYINKLYKIIVPISKFKLIKMTNTKECFNLYNMYYKQFDCYDVFTLDLFEKTFLSEHIHTYILTNNNIILDFISYYTIDVTVVKKNTNTLDGYMYYYTNMSNNLKIMIELLLVILKNNNIDTFKALNIMDNMSEIYTGLKFINENNNMYYYFFSNNNSNNKFISNNKFAKILL